ncbi:hypothetical protein X777_09124 [Ooceraea biroi]|uniref:Odorant receptor n=1 Tax=Ooceraea biroi TaxID=2015173 RepID=A0A026W921_OOCBI|nr:hypothetical protein X777_09124 [Ooceraea biroi]
MSNARERCATSQNSNYQRDIRYAFKLNSWILGSLGIWPHAIRNIGQYVSNITIVFHNFLLGFTIVPLLLYMLYDESNAKLKKCGLLIFCLAAMIKYLILAIRRPKIQLCIEYIKYDWWQVTFVSDREMMLKYAVTGRNLTIIGTLFMYGAGIFYFVKPIYMMKSNNQTLRPVVYPIYSQFGDVQNSPKYEIVYAVHCMCGYTMYTVATGTCGLVALFVTHACGQIQMIISRLQNLLVDESLVQTQNIHQRIVAIVKRHVRVQRFAAVVEGMLQEVCLVEFASSVCTICLLEYYCILNWQENDKVGVVSYSLLFVSCCFNVYILCHIGELLMEKSSQIGSVCYMINWYQISPKLVRSMIMIIAMSSHPTKLTAGGMVDLSLSTFGNVMKTSIAYLSFLRTLVM